MKAHFNTHRLWSLILTSEQGYRAGLATAALFGFLLVCGSFSLLGNWWSDARLSTVSGAETAALQDLSSPFKDLAQTLPNAHLFGYKAPASAYVPITSLQLRLTGIIQTGSSDEDSAFSKAIISSQGGIGKVYQIGDIVMDGIRVSGISADSVVLDNNGHSERLPLQRPRLEK